MIRSLKLFAACVESLRTAEQEYEKDPTPFNKSNVTALQNKVDGWIAWVHKQEDASLAKNVPPFIGQPRKQNYKGVMNNDLMAKLMANHTPEEIEKYTKLMQGKF